MSDKELKAARTRQFYNPVLVALGGIGVTAVVGDYTLSLFAVPFCVFFYPCGFAIVSLQTASATKDWQIEEIAMAGFRGSCVAVLLGMAAGVLLGQR